ncbi:hypothetical protein CCP3SC1AL1_50033 [Gammaproteobacteria bacterium]
MTTQCSGVCPDLETITQDQEIAAGGEIVMITTMILDIAAITAIIPLGMVGIVTTTEAGTITGTIGIGGAMTMGIVTMVKKPRTGIEIDNGLTVTQKILGVVLGQEILPEHLKIAREKRGEIQQIGPNGITPGDVNQISIL